MCYIKPLDKFNVDNDKNNNIYINIHELELDHEIIPELINNEDDSFLHVFKVTISLIIYFYLIFNNIDFIFTYLGLV